MSFKKPKGNQNEIKPSGRKQKIFTTILLSLNLLFGKARLSFSRSSSPNFDNLVVQERVIDDREFNSLEENDQQVILVKGENNPLVIMIKSEGHPSIPPTNRGPSHFPVLPPSGGRPSRPVQKPTPYTYRVTPKVVEQGFNPAGGGGGKAEFDDPDTSLAPNKKQSQESSNQHFGSTQNDNDKKKKKKSKDECPIINESFKSNSSLKKVTKRALGNQDVNREYKRIQKRISEGVDPMDIGRGSTDLGDGLTYVRGKHGRKNDNGVKDFVGIAYRGSKNDMKTLAKEMNKLYNVNINPAGY